MSLAERAVLLRLHSLRVELLFFCHVVIPLFALGTCQSNSRAHRVHLQLTFILSIFKAQKKEPRPFSSLSKRTITHAFRQGIFEIFPRKTDKNTKIPFLFRFTLTEPEHPHVFNEPSRRLFNILPGLQKLGL